MTTTQINGTEYTVDGDFLTGPKGATYYLRPFLGVDTGEREVVSIKTGAPLRDKAGRAVRVFVLGDVIERVAA